MKRYLVTLLTVLSIFFGIANPPVASAKEPDGQMTKHTIIGPWSSAWSNLNQDQLDFLKANTPFLEFQGALCKVVSLGGCKVVRSENLTISVGDTLQIKVVRQHGRAISSAAFKASCSWCGFVLTSIEIVAFVVAAPAATPAWMIYSTYFVGSSIFLGNL